MRGTASKEGGRESSHFVCRLDSVSTPVTTEDCVSRGAFRWRSPMQGSAAHALSPDAICATGSMRFVWKHGFFPRNSTWVCSARADGGLDLRGPVLSAMSSTVSGLGAQAAPWGVWDCQYNLSLDSECLCASLGAFVVSCSRQFSGEKALPVEGVQSATPRRRRNHSGSVCSDAANRARAVLG